MYQMLKNEMYKLIIYNELIMQSNYPLNLFDNLGIPVKRSLGYTRNSFDDLKKHGHRFYVYLHDGKRSLSYNDQFIIHARELIKNIQSKLSHIEVYLGPCQIGYPNPNCLVIPDNPIVLEILLYSKYLPSHNCSDCLLGLAEDSKMGWQRHVPLQYIYHNGEQPFDPYGFMKTKCIEKYYCHRIGFFERT